MIWIIGGTKDSRVIAKELSKNNKKLIVSTATPYGKKLLEDMNIEVLDKRMNFLDMKELIKDKQIKLLIDASHPYADKVSKEAIKACHSTASKYVRFEREMLKYDGALKFDSIGEICKYLNSNSNNKNIMSTLGSKNLSDLLEIKDKNKLYIRILPTTSSIKNAEELGYQPKNIIALQGPFSREFNRSLIRNYEIEFLLTKESGATGGELEKVEACIDEDVKLLALKRPFVDYPLVFNDINTLLKYVYKQK